MNRFINLLYRRTPKCFIREASFLDRLFNCIPRTKSHRYTCHDELHKLAKMGKTEWLQMLIDAGLNPSKPDRKNRTLLHFACAYNQPQIVQILLDAHYKIDFFDHKSTTPLSVAVQCGYLLCTCLLLKSGADPEAMDESGKIPLHHAIKLGNNDMVELLLMHGVNTETTTRKHGLTPLLLALKEKQIEMAKNLISKGASLLAVDNHGRNCLIYAVRADSEEVIQLLLERGVDVFHEDDFGWNALQYALQRRFNVLDMLLEYTRSCYAADEDSSTETERKLSNEELRPSVSDNAAPKDFLGRSDADEHNSISESGWRWCYHFQGENRILKSTGKMDAWGGSHSAQAVLIDMEEGVVNELLQGPLRDIFDGTQLITDQSGSGNNWAVGHKVFGSLYREQILEKLRKSAEHCDCLQSFFVIHSMGGGTGSGLGTFLLKVLEDEFPEVFRFVTSVYPASEDDVITSPYNSMLAMKELQEHADCVLPIDNQSLFDTISKIDLVVNSGKSGTAVRTESLLTSHARTLKKRSQKPFDAANNIVANLLLSLTRLDQMFSDAFSKDHQLIQADPKHSLYLACALMVRGNVQISDLRRNIERLKPTLRFVSWNQEGWKTSLCSVPPVGHSHSLLALANNTCVKPTFMDLRERFRRLYKKKAHLHHYLQVEGMEESCFAEAAASLSALIQEYHELDATRGMPGQDVPRLSIAV